jgi:hypothetical protein
LTDPGGIPVRPVPMAIEQAGPGGVSCTNRGSRSRDGRGRH